MAEGDLSMLDQMASGVMERKEAAAARAKLTPVKGERAPTPGLPDVPEVFLTNEVLANRADSLRAYAATLIEVADGIDVIIERAANPVLRIVADDEGVDVKAAEKEADAKAAARKAAKDKPLTPETTAAEFADKQAAQQAEAQEQAFATLKAGVAQPEDDIVEGVDEPSPIAVALEEDMTADADGFIQWVCPDHGSRQETKSRKGRDMVACGSYPAECQKFELPA